ncbi:MAG: ABC transporter substrate-binding protein [Archaeoglobaceae archaeon]
MKKLKIGIMLSLVFLAAFLAFCISEEQKVKEIRVSYQPSWHHTALFVIIEKGWDEKILGAKIVTSPPFASGPPQMEAFASGQHDIAYVGAAPPLSLLSRGFDAKIVAVANTEGSAIIARQDIVYNGPKSLEGKSIMTYQPGSIQHTVLMKWLKDNNVDISKVDIKYGGPAEIREALRAKAVDFGFAPDPTPLVAEIEGYGKIVAGSSDLSQNHPCCVVLMSGKFMRENEEVAAKFLALHIIASEYAKDPKNKEEIKQILIKWLGISEAVAEKFPGTTNLQTDPRDKNWQNGLNLLCEAQYELGLTKDSKGSPVKLKAEDIVDVKLYEKALSMVPKIKSELGLK